MTLSAAITALETEIAKGTLFVTYGDGDLGMAIPIADALADFKNMDEDAWNDGEFFVCDENGALL